MDKRLAFERRIRVISAVFGIISIRSVSNRLTIRMNDLQNTSDDLLCIVPFLLDLREKGRKPQHNRLASLPALLLGGEGQASPVLVVAG